MMRTLTNRGTVPARTAHLLAEVRASLAGNQSCRTHTHLRRPTLVQVDSATPAVVVDEPLIAAARNFRRPPPVQVVVIGTFPIRGGSAGYGHE